MSKIKPFSSPSFQILMSVWPTSITAMSMLSVITLRDLTTALVSLDTQEMEHHAPVKHQAKCIFKWPYQASLFRLQAKSSFYCGNSNICLDLFKYFILILFNNPIFSDINECTAIAHNCHVNAFCNNTEGSHNCTCSPGYTGSGTSCRGKLSS